MSQFDDSLQERLKVIQPHMEKLVLRPSPWLEWLPKPVPAPWWRQLLHPRFYIVPKARYAILRRLQRLAEIVSPYES